MRNAFLDTLFDLAEHDRRIVLITGDLGYRVVERFQERLPDQFLNAGVAEQNMTSIAAGMAMSGRIVFTYSIANFPTLRCLEQIRNDVCYHDANVKIVSVGGGLAYGAMSATHHAVEDLGVMRCLPNLVVIAPGDPEEARAATRAAVSQPGPVYLRLGKAGEPIVHEGPIEFHVGRAIRVQEGHDVGIVATGGMLHTAVRAAERLAQSGIQARVLSMHTLKPIDEDAIVACARETGVVVTLEEHSIVGGLGSAVAEVLAERQDVRPVFRRLGLPSAFSPHIGSQHFLLEQHGLSVDAVAGHISRLLQSRHHSARADVSKLLERR